MVCTHVQLGERKREMEMEKKRSLNLLVSAIRSWPTLEAHV